MYTLTAVNNDSAGIPQAYVNQAYILLRCQQNLDVRSNQISVFDISLQTLLTY
jgi:hypothetical protein